MSWENLSKSFLAVGGKNLIFILSEQKSELINCRGKHLPTQLIYVVPELMGYCVSWSLFVKDQISSVLEEYF